MKESPRYIKSLLVPNGQKAVGRKVWGIDLELCWLPFFLATNLMGDTAIPHEALGSPLRLGYSSDGAVKFTKTGRPQIKVAKEISDSVRIVRENFVATLNSYSGSVINTHPDDYKGLVNTIKIAGEPIQNKDKVALQEALKAQVEEAIGKAEAEATPTEETPHAEKEAVPA